MGLRWASPLCWCMMSSTNDNSYERLVRPYGLTVRSFRTMSPKPSDWEFGYVGLNASLRQFYLWCRLTLWRKKSRNSKMSLTYSHDPSQIPMYKGLRAREGYLFSLTSPSLFSLWTLTSGKRNYVMWVNVTQNVRVTWGTFVLPHIPQTPCV